MKPSPSALANKDNTEYQTVDYGTVYGCESTKTYCYYYSCPTLKNALTNDTHKVIIFRNELAAVKAGYHPCDKCLKEKI